MSFQSPPPKRGACDSHGGATPAGPLSPGFQSPPPKRGACDARRGLTHRGDSPPRRFNPLRRSGGRATRAEAEAKRLGLVSEFQSPPPKRGACDALAEAAAELTRQAAEVSIPSAEAGGVRPPLPSTGGRGITPWRFNPLRRSGGRATRRTMNDTDLYRAFLVSIPSAEAGGVRRRSRTWSRRWSPPCAWFQSPPPKRGACDTGAVLGPLTTATGSFQSPPPKRGACDRAASPPWRRSRAGRRFNPLRRSGGRATAPTSTTSRSSVVSRFNPLRRSGGRAT